MAIPESQLETWSSQGSVTQSKNTYARIKNALEASDAPYAGKGYESFLQGSYGNDTNIYADSDVDIVMKLNSTFYHDLTWLKEPDLSTYMAAREDGTYSWSEFRRDVVARLSKDFGSDVDASGKKAIWIKPNAGRRNADVLVAVRLRRFYSFKSWSDQRCDEGICFFLPNGERIDNFPKQHSANLTAKNQETSQRFKPTIRIFKNMRTKMVEVGLLADGVAPSYFLEGMLYNVPKEKFGTSRVSTVAGCFNWILEADWDKLECANRLYWLVRSGSHVCWSPDNFRKFLDATKEFWDQWGS